MLQAFRKKYQSFYCFKEIKLNRLDNFKIFCFSSIFHFHFIENSDSSRRSNDFKQLSAGNTLKQMFVSVSGVKQWNSVENHLKCCSNIFQFNCKYKQKILSLYKDECENCNIYNDITKYGLGYCHF